MKLKIFLISSLLSIFSYLSSMKIDRVILSVNGNPYYADFWPIVAKRWQELGVKPTLALICDKKIEIDESLGDVIRFDPIPGVIIPFQATTIRLLLPCLFKDDVCILSDIDLLPIKKDFFIDAVANIPDDKFVMYTNQVHSPGTYGHSVGLIAPTCFNAAKGKVFQEIFGINKKEDISKTIQNWFDATLKLVPSLPEDDQMYFFYITDERMLTKHLRNWTGFNSQIIKLGHNFDHLLERRKWEYNISDFKNNYYFGAHLPRPYYEHDKKELVDKLLIELNLEHLIP